MNFETLRKQMVDNQIKSRDILNKNVIEAFLKVPREKFVPEEVKFEAYFDKPLPIGYGAFISQPYIVARICEILNINLQDKVLDIGTGSGYQAAILGQIAGEVITVERIKELVQSARVIIDELGYTNVTVIHGDGSKGCPQNAPYDAIAVAAATEDVPQEWMNQLSMGGRLVFPKKRSYFQVLTKIERTSSGFIETSFDIVRFVPLIKQ